MNQGPRQLPLDLAHRPALGAEDFFLSGSNASAVELIDRWPDWPHHGQVLTGPAASGKSHLVNVWRLQAGAARLTAADLSRLALPALGIGRPLVLEDIDRDMPDETALFHLLNRVREEGGSLLLTSRVEVAALPVALKDLKSRLVALPSVAIEPPDDALLRAVMVKQFADRQLDIDPGLVEYVLRRIERSFEALARTVTALDAGSLATGRRITRALARNILEDG